MAAVPAVYDRIYHNTGYHPPSSEQVAEAHSTVRSAAAAFMRSLANVCPESRELSLALTAAEEALMWANAAIARNQAAA